ncbi:MAG: radical SAM protein [Brevinematia bacterium]
MRGRFSYIFGPIPSRRLGMSLGVDIIPHKICIYDCVFCEVGRTKRQTAMRREYVRKDDVIKELEAFFSCYDGKIDHITITGEGETTLNSRLGEIISEVKDRFRYPVAVLTHSGNIYDEGVRNGLLLADVVCPSLDAVTQETFEKVNRPINSVRIEKIIEGLVRFREEFKNKILLEVLLVKGINDSEEELRKIGETCCLIKPDIVQISTVDRPGAYPDALPLSSEELRKAKMIISSYYANVEVLSRHYVNPEPLKKDIIGLREDIVEILRRRPLTVLDVVIAEGIDFFKAKQILSDLEREGVVEEVQINGTKFFKLAIRR